MIVIVIMKKLIKIIQLIFGFCKSLIVYKYYSMKFKKIDFFQYKTLANPNFCCIRGFASSTHYGNHLAVSHLIHKRINFIREYIEHGVSFYSNPECVRLLGYIDRKGIKTVYTFSEQRVDTINEYLKTHNLHRKIVPVGPYILGANHHKSTEELVSIKKQAGRILLVFPTHSCETNEVNYSVEFLINKIKERRNEFNTVFVCLYWMEVLKYPQVASLYEAQGYTVVSAGHRSDPLFLSRLKDIISLSDMVFTNGIGTHIGYSICLSKPVCFINEDLNKSDIFHEDEGIKSVREKLIKLFSDFSQTITHEQIAFTEYYYGKWERI